VGAAIAKLAVRERTSVSRTHRRKEIIMRAAEQIRHPHRLLPTLLRPERRADTASPVLATLERGAGRAGGALQQATRAATGALQRSTHGWRRYAGVGAGLGALRLARAHPAVTAGLVLGAIGVAALIWRRRHAAQQQESPPPAVPEPEPDYL
jgi:hypothetical protein